VGYFTPQQAGKIGPGTIHGFPDSTSRRSKKNAGQVNSAKRAIQSYLFLGGSLQLSSRHWGNPAARALPVCSCGTQSFISVDSR
jgi:hypothetical protein